MSMWQPIETAPYRTRVIVRTARHTFPAMLMPEHSITEDEQSCDQWVACEEGNHPRNWTDGCCWTSNADEQMSDQPLGWMAQ